MQADEATGCRPTQRAYAAIGEEIAAETKLGAVRAQERGKREKRRRQLVWQQRCCGEAVAQFDAFEAAMRQVQEAIECVDLESGALRDAGQVSQVYWQRGGEEFLDWLQAAELGRSDANLQFENGGSAFDNF